MCPAGDGIVRDMDVKEFFHDRDDFGGGQGFKDGEVNGERNG